MIQDEVNNVIIFQPGTPGYEESEPVILQGHMDMVCEKTSESTHDFENDGLELYVEDGFLKAKDTTLGEMTELLSQWLLHCWIAERFHIRQLRQYYRGRRTWNGRCGSYRPDCTKRVKNSSIWIRKKRRP